MQETLLLPETWHVARGWRIFIYIGSALMIPLFIWVGTLPFTGEGDAGWGINLFMIAISLAMIGLSGWGLLETIKGKIVLEADRLVTVEAFKTRELLFSQIRGYRADQYYVRIVPVRKDLPTLKVSTYLGDMDRFTGWLAENFDDLDVVEAATEEELILASEAFGRTTEERELKLAEARNVCRILNYSALAAGLWAMIFPSPYELVMGLCLALPLLVLPAMYFYRGLIRLDEKKTAPILP